MKSAFSTWVICGLALVVSVTAQPLQTRAEATGYAETSRYADVMAFLEGVTARSPLMHRTSYGYTTEGRAMPLVVVGAVAAATPEAVRASGKLRVLLQGNIHAGEVEGKEALLELLREIAAGAHPAWADSLVLLVTPIYNADGNERVGLYNRPWQHGPVGGMGQRPNAQGLDLNRDHTKLASPEARAFTRLLNEYDPHVTLDLHTTDGSFHGYHLTYAPGLNPNTAPPLDAFLRTRLFPAVTETLAREDRLLVYYYGNFDGFEQRPKNNPPGWYTFDHRPRFNNSYVALRNRVAILSEAYSYLPFEERIFATKQFVAAILDYAATHAPAVRRAIVQAEAAPVAGTPVAVRSDFAAPDTVQILVGDVTEERNPYTGALMYRRASVARPTTMLEYGTFAGTEFVTAPQAYLVPASEKAVLERLEAHGIRHVPAPPEAQVEAFRIDSVRTATRAFQNVNEQTLFGAYERLPAQSTEGMRMVPVAGPLARLTVYLLEPRSDDGFVNWGLFEGRLQGATVYPILRVPSASPGN